ncbi:hypothetical protein GCM10020254_08620 [Streptomyces goshikiensis]
MFGSGSDSEGRKKMTGEEGLPRPEAPSGWTTRRWLRVGVAVSLVVLTLLGVTGAWVLARTTAISRDLVDVKSPALTTSIHLESALLNQETGIRGYGLTGNAQFLVPYQQGLTDQEAFSARLAELLHDDPGGLRDVQAVADTAQAWQERIARPIAAATPVAAPALAAERAAEGKAAFDAVRAALAEQQRELQADRAHARGRPDGHHAAAELDLRRGRAGHPRPRRAGLRGAAPGHHHAAGTARRGRPPGLRR